MNILCWLGIHSYEDTSVHYPPSLYSTFNLVWINRNTCSKCGKEETCGNFIFKESFGKKAHDYAVSKLESEGYNLEEYFNWLKSREDK